VLRLAAKCSTTWNAGPVVARLTTAPAPAPDHAYLTSGGEVPDGFAFGVRVGGPGTAGRRLVAVPADMAFLADGDVVRYAPATGHLAVLYRRASPSNAIFTTERCNSNCLMCSQPPRAVDDRHLTEAYLRAIPLMAKDTPELGITGGEPTLLGDDLFRLVRACLDHLPRTGLHLLSNGRLFAYLSLCRGLAAVGHPDLMVGVPLYADVAGVHDFVVQARGAFDQTVRGIMNLARCGVRVEIRVVLHRQTVPRLPQLARFLARNFPYASQVALMGLEPTGHVKANLDALWVDPAHYQAELAAAVGELDDAGIRVRIYNHQLCTLAPGLWPFAVRSISDWKNEYLPVCGGCSVRATCGGFFASAALRRSELIRPVAADEVPPAGAPGRESGLEGARI
jgi:His-Xaa-Ser system radical SAM maturase HxsC